MATISTPIRLSSERPFHEIVAAPGLAHSLARDLVKQTTYAVGLLQAELDDRAQSAWSTDPQSRKGYLLQVDLSDVSTWRLYANGELAVEFSRDHARDCFAEDAFALTGSLRKALWEADVRGLSQASYEGARVAALMGTRALPLVERFELASNRC